MNRFFVKVSAVLLFFALLPRPYVFGEEMACEPLAEHALEIHMDMDTSSISETALTELICAQSLEYTVEYGGQRVEFGLVSGESKRLSLGQYSGKVTVEQRIPAAFLQRFGTPQVYGQWSARGAINDAGAVSPDSAADWVREYTFRSASGKATVAERPEVSGLCTLSEMKIATVYELKDVKELTLRLCNTPTVEEYGSLCVTLGESKDDCDILVWLGEGSAAPVSVGTRYLHWDGSSWVESKVESAGLVSLSPGQSALFPRVPAKAQYCVRVTKKSAQGCAVSYFCDALGADAPYGAELLKNGDVLSVSGLMIPRYTALLGEMPIPTVTVTVNNLEK